MYLHQTKLQVHAVSVHSKSSPRSISRLVTSRLDCRFFQSRNRTHFSPFRPLHCRKTSQPDTFPTLCLSSVYYYGRNLLEKGCISLVGRSCLNLVGCSASTEVFGTFAMPTPFYYMPTSAFD